MKSYLRSCFTVIILTCINNLTYAQGNSHFTKLTTKTPLEKLIPSSRQFDSRKGSGLLFRSDININAVRNFIIRYGDVSRVTWRQSDNGSAAYFNMNDIRTCVYFHKNGEYDCMIRYYREDKLPEYIRHLVKSRYYDYAIFSVAELSKKEKTIYDVKIEDKTSFKTIRINDGEIEVREEFLKR